MAGSKDQRIEHGRQLARELFEWTLPELMRPDEQRLADLRVKYRRLSQAQFDDVLRQVREAKLYQQERIGWQAVPHDIAVLVLVLVTVVVDLRVGIAACIGVLVLLESLFQFYFNRKLYRPLSFLVWLTYPAYLLFGYWIYRMGYGIPYIVVGVLLASLGTFVLGALSRLPVRMILEARARGRQEGEQRRKAPSDKRT